MSFLLELIAIGFQSCYKLKDVTDTQKKEEKIQSVSKLYFAYVYVEESCGKKCHESVNVMSTETSFDAA